MSSNNNQYTGANYPKEQQIHMQSNQQEPTADTQNAKENNKGIGSKIVIIVLAILLIVVCVLAGILITRSPNSEDDIQNTEIVSTTRTEEEAVEDTELYVLSANVDLTLAAITFDGEDPQEMVAKEVARLKEGDEFHRFTEIQYNDKYHITYAVIESVAYGDKVIVDCPDGVVENAAYIYEKLN